MSVLPATGQSFDIDVPVLVIGGGACGMVAALAARDAGAEVAVIERDRVPRGSTALSSGLVPACGTRFQRAQGIEDSVELFAGDIQRKAHGRNDTTMVEAIARESGPAVDWLAQAHHVPFSLVQGFLYPGHSVLRMHGPPERTGAQLIGALTSAAEAAGVMLVTDALVTDVFAGSGGRVRGARYVRPDGSSDAIGCTALILACSGFGGNAELVQKFIPEMATAKYFGHVGNRGDALVWGQALGAAVDHMGAYQGHGSVAVPQEVLITWAIMMEGGIQVNADGLRFSNEHGGYSEQAIHVLRQPGGMAWCIFDRRTHDVAAQFEDFRNAAITGAIRSADSAASLAHAVGLPPEKLERTLADVERLAQGDGSDSYGRDFTTKPPLRPPFFAVKVTGALFHTQGGLVVDFEARVLRSDRTRLPNLFAGGGAACGVSGTEVSGYLSGNGLLAAVTLGRIAGKAAAALAMPGGGRVPNRG